MRGRPLDSAIQAQRRENGRCRPYRLHTVLGTPEDADWAHRKSAVAPGAHESSLPLPDKSAPKKVVAKSFILNQPSRQLSSVPVWAEPSQLLILNSPTTV